MKNIVLPALLISALLNGCSTSYQSTQTPDDLYYSPGSPAKQKPVASKEVKQYENDLAYSDDQFLWMKVQNYYLWNGIDDYNYWYMPGYYNPVYTTGGFYGYYPNLGCPIYSSGSYFGKICSPPLQPIIPIYVKYKKPRLNITSNTSGSNIIAYKNRQYSNTNPNYNFKNGNVAGNSGSGFGQLLRRTFIPANGSTSNSYSNPIRVSSPSIISIPSSGGGASAGGYSGGASSTGSSSSGGRGGRGN